MACRCLTVLYFPFSLSTPDTETSPASRGGRAALRLPARPLPAGGNSPQTPRTSVQQVCLFCLMDKSTSGMDMWTRQSLDHIPTSEHLTTGATPSA